MENKKMFGLLSLGMIALLGVSMVAAYQGDYSVEGPNYSEDRHEAMKQAFDDADYDAWVVLMSEGGRHSRVMDIVNEDNFEMLVEAHEASRAGDFERAAELRAELGLNNGMGPKDGSGHRDELGMRQNSEMQGQRNCRSLE